MAVLAGRNRMAWTDENRHGLYIAALLGGTITTVQEPGGARVDIDAHALSPDGNWIAFIRLDDGLDVDSPNGPSISRQDLYNIYIAPTGGGVPRRLTDMKR